MGPSVMQMLSNLQKEVTECEQEQTKFFGDKLKQFISETANELSCISSRATTLRQRIRNPLPSLGFSSLPNTTTSAPFVVPDLLADAQKLLNLHSKPSAPAGSPLPTPAVPDDPAIQGASAGSNPPVPPVDVDDSVCITASADERESQDALKKGSRKGNGGKKITSKNNTHREEAHNDNISKKTSVESGSSGFRTPLSSSPSPADKQQSSVPASHPQVSPTHSGSARVTPVRTRSMKQSDRDPFTADIVRVPSASKRLSFSEDGTHDLEAKVKPNGDRHRTKRKSDELGGKRKQRPRSVKHSLQLVKADSVGVSNDLEDPNGSPEVPLEERQEATRRSPEPVPIVHRVKRRKNLIVESPESASPPRLSGDGCVASPTETTNRSGCGSQEVRMLDINTGVDNPKIDWLSKHARTTVNLDEYVEDRDTDPNGTKVDEPRALSDRMDVELWEVPEAPNLAEIHNDESRSCGQRPGTFNEVRQSGLQNRADCKLAKEILHNDADDVEQRSLDVPVQKNLFPDSFSNNEGLDASTEASNPKNELVSEVMSASKGTTITMDVRQDGENGSALRDTVRDVDTQDDSETSRRVSKGKILDDATQDTDDEIFESAVSQEFSPADVQSKQDCQSRDPKPSKKSVTFKDCRSVPAAESSGPPPISQHQTAPTSFQVGHDGKISTAAVDELFKMMSEPSQKKTMSAENAEKFQPDAGGPGSQPHETSRDPQPFQSTKKKVFSSKQSSRLPHTPGAHPPVSTIAGSDSRLVTSQVEVNSSHSGRGIDRYQSQSQDESGSGVGVKRSSEGSNEDLGNANERSIICSPQGMSKLQKRIGDFASHGTENISPEPSAPARKDDVSCRIREILSSAPAVKSEAKRQIEMVRAERLASQSGAKLLTRTFYSNARDLGRDASFAYTVPKPEPVLAGRGLDSEVCTGGQPSHDHHSRSALEARNDKSLQSQHDGLSGSFTAPGRKELLKSDGNMDRSDTSSPTPKSWKQPHDADNRIGQDARRCSSSERSEAQQNKDPVVNTKTSNELPSPSSESGPEFRAGSAIMNLVTSVTSFLPSASELVGWRQQITKDVEKESAEEVAERQRLDAERREAEIQARREALRLQKQKEIEEKQRRAEIKRKALAEEERLREEKRRRKEEMRLQKKRDEDEEKRRKKMEEERKREERRQQVLLKRKQMQEQIEHEKELESKRLKHEKMAKSAMESGLVLPSSSTHAGRKNLQNQEFDQMRTPRPKKAKSEIGDASNYVITPARETILEASADEKRRRRGKHVPRWAKSGNVMQAIERNETDPDDLFANAPMCNLSDLFGEQRKYRTRSSSGNWAFDRLTAQEKFMYKKVTRGFDEDEKK